MKMKKEKKVPQGLLYLILRSVNCGVILLFHPGVEKRKHRDAIMGV